MYRNLQGLSRLLAILATLFVIWFVLSSPNDAGNMVHSIFGGIQTAANQLAAFIKSIAG